MSSVLNLVDDHLRIIWALMLRELATRYGRNNLGFLWVIAEPLVFCAAVLLLWRAIRGPYENGLEVIPFVLTGYMPTILVRHMVMYSLNAVRVNSPLLYHRNITVLDLMLARVVLEFIGVTLGFFLIFGVLLAFGLAKPPENLALAYEGWFITAWVGFGLALVIGSVSEMQEVVERTIGVALYIVVPLSGTFFLADWLPTDARNAALVLPFLHCSEMIRAGFFGASVHPHYDAGYAAAWGAGLTLLGLLLIRHVRDRVELY
jgi:capsular polysaccharide transport system permease protein